jgi:hypothetical protein
VSEGGGLVPKEELRAALEARRELGPEYDEHVLESFARELEKKFDERYSRQVIRKRSEHKDKELALAIVSLVFAIPALAIAGGIVGLAGIVAVSVAIVLVNLVFRL